MTEPSDPMFATCVVGAGPAGLLFCLLAGIRREQLGLASAWPIVVVDKRNKYERSHRLRIDPDPYQTTQSELAHPLLDELIGFLDEQSYRPAANALETVLMDLVSRLNIPKLKATVGPGVDEFDLSQLRGGLQAKQIVGDTTWLSIVGADSVTSATRALVAGDAKPIEQVHQTVARLRIDGPGLPDKLDRVRQFKLAKLLGSALDYRSNPNGFAEVDLFLSPEEHEAVVALGARPATPVELTPAVLNSLDAPLFVGVAQYAKGNLGTNECTASVSSTFRLEHRYSEQVAFSAPNAGAHVFLAGDAAVSLPFFRGMACLMKCVSELAAIHADVAAAAVTNDSLAAAGARYNDSVAATRAAEVRTVETRARGVKAAREIVRISSMSPFPIQTWLLSVRPFLQPAGRLTGQLAATVLVASIAAALAIASPQIGALGLLSLPLQAISGFSYRSNLDAPSGPNLWMNRFCRLQMTVLMVAGAVVAAINPFSSGGWIRAGALVGWFVLGLVFIAGMYLAESSGQAD